MKCLASFSVTAVALLSLSFVVGCGSNSSSSAMAANATNSGSTDGTSNASQASMNEAGSQSGAGEGPSGTLALLGQDAADSANEIGQFVDANDQVHPLTTSCTWASVRQTCSSNARTILWGGCTLDQGRVALTGGWSEAYSGNSTSCSMAATGDVMTRTTSSSVATRTFAGGATTTVTTDTNGGTAWDGTTIPSTGTVITATGANYASRTIMINGTHRKSVLSTGPTVYEHFITSPSALTVSGNLTNATRSISSGTVNVYHQIAHYTASTVFNNVAWQSAACCYPTSGSMTATLTGSVTGSTTLNFTSTCGAATFVDTTGVSTSLTLTACN